MFSSSYMFTANQDVHALTQKAIRFLPISTFKLNLETSAM